MEIDAKIFAIDTKEGTVSIDIRPDDIDDWLKFWIDSSDIKITVNADFQ